MDAAARAETIDRLREPDKAEKQCDPSFSSRGRTTIGSGWRSSTGQTQRLGEEMGHYVIATTTDTDESGPKTPGRINGGFFAKKADWPAQHPSIVIAADDIDKSISKVGDAGGRVLVSIWGRSVRRVHEEGTPCVPHPSPP